MNLQLKLSHFLKETSNRYVINGSYILLSFYVVFYTIFSLTIINLQIFPIINRVTYFDTTVFWTITDSLVNDLLLTSVIFGIAIGLSFRTFISIPLSTLVIFPLLVGAIGINVPLEISYAIFFSSFPILVTLLILERFFKNKNFEKEYQLNGLSLDKFLKIFFIMIASLEAVTLLRWAIYPITLDESLDWTWKLNFLENNLFYAFGIISPPLIILTLFSFLIKPNYLLIQRFVFKYFLRQTDETKVNIQKDNHTNSQKLANTNLKNVHKFSSKKDFKVIVILIGLAIVPSILVSFYPYVVLSTDENTTYGTDVRHYLAWINELTSERTDMSSILYQGFVEVHSGSRPFSVMSMYYLSVLTSQSQVIVLKYLPLLLGPLLVTSIYFLTKTAYPENKNIAIIAAIMTAASHQIVIGFYAAFYANWMALVTMFIASLFLLRVIKEPRHLKKNVVLYSVFITVTIFFHSYTWSYFLAVLILFLAWSTIHNKFKKRSIKIFLILIIVTCGITAIDVIKSNYIESSDIFEQDLSLTQERTGTNEFTFRWENLHSTFNVYVGGFLTNSAFFILLLLWAIFSKYDNISDRLFLSFLFVGILPVLFGDVSVQARILYNIPFQIPVSIILYKIYKNPVISFRKPLVISIMLIQFNYILRGMSNMEFSPP